MRCREIMQEVDKGLIPTVGETFMTSIGDSTGSG